jgi:two-component system response regulator AtoC
MSKGPSPEGRFREDLFYRIKGITIETSALSERREDIPLLVQHFLAVMTQQQGQTLQLAPSALQWFLQRDWPGNVRELRNTLESVVAISRQGVVQLADIQLLHGELMDTPENEPVLPADLDGGSLEQQVRALEIQLLSQALQQAGGNRSQAARQLGLSRQGLLKKIERYGLVDIGHDEAN